MAIKYTSDKPKSAKEKADAAEKKAKANAARAKAATARKAVAEKKADAPAADANTPPAAEKAAATSAAPTHVSSGDILVSNSGNGVFEIHPFADAYPHMSDEIYQPFKQSLLKDGQHVPIIVIPHPSRDAILQIIDGRHRYNALEELGLPVKYEYYSGPTDEDSLRRYVESQNVHRRDLSQGQRAMSAARLYAGNMGRPKKSEEMGDEVAEEIASRNGVSLTTLRRAIRISRLSSRFPKFIEHVFEGRIELAPAHDMVADFEQTDTKLKRLNVTTEDFRKIEEAPSSIGEIIRRSKQAEKKAKRDERDERIAGLAEQLPDDEYQIVYADPPWKFEVRSEEGMDRSAENHYPTMTLKDIKEAKPAFAKSAVLFLWTTTPFLVHAIDLIEAWGLTYKSHFIWGKDKIGMGYWNRANHEMLIVATTEDGFPSPADEDKMPSLQIFPRGKHSEKPPEYAEWIERCWPTAKKLEMYCRAPRDGWDVWGNESSGVPLSEQISQDEGEASNVSDDDSAENDDGLHETIDGVGDDNPDQFTEGDESEDDREDVGGAEDDDGFFDSSLDPLNIGGDTPPGL